MQEQIGAYVKDLTQGSINKHIVAMSVPVAAGMVFQTLYYLVDLYFVAQLGDAAIAGVSAGGNVAFIVMALTQVLGVGTVALMSNAVGRKDQAAANLVFNQALLLALLCALSTLLLGYLLVSAYMDTVAADKPSAEAGLIYLYWYLPGLALQFALIAMGSALRATGIVQPTMVVQAISVLLNAILAPVLIAGWGTGHALGVAGAGLASTLAIAFAVALLWMYFRKLEKYVSFHPEQWRPRLQSWKQILNVGLPAGGEFALLFLYTGVVYWTIRHFGAAAQAGFGVGSRVMQAIFLPAMAVAFAAAPIAGQNFGAHQHNRVRETFRQSAVISALVMGSLALLCQWRPESLIAPLAADPEVVVIGAEFLHIISWNFAMQGIIFTCSSLFQALGNTWPSLLSSATRMTTFVIPAIWLSTQPDLQLRDVWYLSIGTVVLQMCVSLLLLKREFRLKLSDQPA